MQKIKFKTDGYTLTNFLLSLLIFVAVIDPSNQIFKAKELFFGLTLLCYLVLCKPKLDLQIIIILLSVLFLNVLAALIGSEALKFDPEFAIGTIKSFLFLFLLLLYKDPKIHWFEKLKIPCIFISVISILIHISTLCFPAIEIAVYSFANSHGQFIMMSHREFLGLPIRQIFYRTAPLLTITLPVYYYRLLFTNASKRNNLICSLLFFGALLGTGTRASMLAVMLIVTTISIYKIFISRWGKVIFLPLFTLFILGGSLLLYKLVTDTGEQSLEVKKGHVTSLIHEIKQPSTLIVGQGIGSQYFSAGFNANTAQSEVSYLEIIRMFGLIGGGLLFCLFLIPVYLCLKNKPDAYGAFALGYISYLFIGGTNPLLVSSTGMLVICVAFSYSSHKQIGTYNEQ